MTLWPTVHARVVELLTELLSVQVYDGRPVTAAPPHDRVTVGYVTDEDTLAGGYRQTRNPNGFQLDEAGAVVVAFTCSGGDSLPAVRTRLFGLVDQFEQSVAADKQLGVLPAGSSSDLASEVHSAQNEAGAAQTVVVTVSYVATI